MVNIDIKKMKTVCLNMHLSGHCNFLWGIISGMWTGQKSLGDGYFFTPLRMCYQDFWHSGKITQYMLGIVLFVHL